MDGECVEQTDEVVGHVVEGVRGPAANDIEERREPQLGKVRRLADIAVVEADDVAPGVGQLFAELVGPGETLGAESHDEHHGRVRVIAERVERDVDAVGVHRCSLHLSTLARQRLLTGATTSS